MSGGAAGLPTCFNPLKVLSSRTLLYEIHERRWDPELCALLDVPIYGPYDPAATSADPLD